MRRHKTFYAIIMMFIFTTYFSQSNVSAYVPKIYPVSPTVAELGKYGTYPVDLSTGLPNIEIPLYIIKSGKLELPIKLMYHASGIKVGQESSWVGLGWSLSAGGQISVDVRDTSDENEPGVYNIPNVDSIYQYMNNHFDGTGHYYMETTYLNRSWVKDAFQIQLPTVNSEFYMINSNAIEKFPKGDYLINFNAGIDQLNKGKFEVIDEKGTQYHFKEKERATRATNPGQETYDSAYLMTKMLLLNDSIEINYQNQFDFIPFYSFSQKQSFTTSLSHNGELTQTLGPVTNVMNTNLPSIAKKISEIKFNDGRLLFILGQNFGKYSGKYLDQIIVEKKIENGYQTVKFIKFYYSLFNGQNNSWGELGRLRLDRVDEETAGDVTTLANFQYNNATLPTLESKWQDYFGYYNGKPNTDLIPKTYIKPNTFFGSANREVDPSFNQMGVLTSIQYATKGKTLFEYETNTFYGKPIHYGEPIILGSLHLDNIGNGGIVPGTGEIDFNTSPPSNICSNSCTYNYCCEGVKSISYNLQDYTQGKVVIKYNITNSNPDITASKHTYARIYVYNNGNTYYKNLKFTSQGQEEFIVAEGDITCELRVWGHTINANVEFQLIPNSPKDTTVYSGGVRVKSIENRDYNDTFISKKIFNYNIPGTNKTSGKSINQNQLNTNWDNNYYYHQFITCFPSGNYNDITTRTYGSSTRGGLESNPVVYEFVEESLIDSLGITNGYSISKLSITPDIVIDGGVGLIKQSQSYKRGKLLHLETYNSSNQLVKKITNSYAINPNKTSYRSDFKIYAHKGTNLTVGNNYANGCYTFPSFYTTNASFEPVKSIIIDSLAYLKTTIQKDFLYNNNTVKELITKVDYLYDEPNHIQLTKQKSITPDLSIQETTYQYAHEKGNQYLIDKNMIGIPLETKVVKKKDSLDANGKILSQVETKYPVSQAEADTKTAGLPVPYEILSKDLQNTTMSKEITYTKYDPSNGNLQEYRLKDLTPVAIIWGYNNTQPIAKIEGATYAQVQNMISSVVTASNTDHTQGTAASEQALVDALDNFRKLPALLNVQITTYTYDPLIGVRSITPPSGIREYYFYDAANRLESIKTKDENGNFKILKEFKYNYKQ